MKVLVDEVPKTTDECIFRALVPVGISSYGSKTFNVYCSIGHTECVGIEKCNKLKKGCVDQNVVD